MVDFSNLFNNDPKKDDDAANLKNDAKNPIELSALFEIKKEVVSAKKDQPKKNLPEKEEPVINKEPMAQAPEQSLSADCVCEARSTYQQAISLSEKVFESTGSITVDEIESILIFVETLVESIKKNDMGMIACVFRYAPNQKVNPYALKLINVCILAIEISVELNYNDLQLVQVGVAAYLHDIGLKKYGAIINQDRKLTPKERKDLEGYHTATREVLAPLKERLGDAIMDIIEESARAHISGAPKGIKGEVVLEAAQIIALADTYEALTHARPYRQKYSPLEAIKIILSDKIFNPKLAKILLERIGLYPKGTFVELSTKETAQVIDQNSKMPTSPVVKIVYDSAGKKVDEGRVVNLAKETEVYIVKSL